METCQRQHHSWLAQKDAASGVHGERHRDRPVMDQHESWAFRWEAGWTWLSLLYPTLHFMERGSRVWFYTPTWWILEGFQARCSSQWPRSSCRAFQSGDRESYKYKQQRSTTEGSGSRRVWPDSLLCSWSWWTLELFQCLEPMLQGRLCGSQWCVVPRAQLRAGGFALLGRWALPNQPSSSRQVRSLVHHHHSQDFHQSSWVGIVNFWTGTWAREKQKCQVELNYIYRERQGSEGREGRGKRGGEREWSRWDRLKDVP